MAFIRSPNELALFAMSQRKKLKLSQVEVGQLVGLKQSTVSAFENKPLDSYRRLHIGMRANLDDFFSTNFNSTAFIRSRIRPSSS